MRHRTKQELVVPRKFLLRMIRRVKNKWRKSEWVNEETGESLNDVTRKIIPDFFVILAWRFIHTNPIQGEKKVAREITYWSIIFFSSPKRNQKKKRRKSLSMHLITIMLERSRRDRKSRRLHICAWCMQSEKKYRFCVLGSIWCVIAKGLVSKDEWCNVWRRLWACVTIMKMKLHRQIWLCRESEGGSHVIVMLPFRAIELVTTAIARESRKKSNLSKHSSMAGEAQARKKRIPSTVTAFLPFIL